MLFCTRLAQLVFLLLTTTTALAQQFDWVRTESVTGNPNSQTVRYPVATDPAGNVVMAGFEGNRTAIGGLIPAGDVALSSYTPAGVQRFRRHLTGGKAAVTHLSYAGASTLMVLGIFRDSVRLGPGRVLRNTSGTTVPFLAGFDASGSPQWAFDLTQLLGGTPLECSAMTTDAAGTVYLACQRSNRESEVLRLTAGLQPTPVVVARHTNDERITSLNLAADGDLYVAGRCTGVGATFGGAAVVSPYNYSAYVARYAASGRLRWVRFAEDVTCPNPQVAADNHGGVYLLMAIVQGGMRVGPFLSAATGSTNEYLLARLDTAGTWQWVRQQPSGSGSSGRTSVNQSPNLVADAQGNAALALSFRGSIAWPTGTVTALGVIGRTDVLVLSYDPAGTLRWVRSGGGLLLEEAHGLAFALDGSFYLTGYSNSGPLVFGPAQGGPATATTQFFVARLTAAQPTASHAAQTGQWQLAPNPAHDGTRLQFAPGAPLPKTVVLHNVLGRVLRTVPVNGASAAIPTADLAPGLYWLSTAAGPVRYRARLVVE